MMLIRIVEQFTILELPRFHPRVDIYASNEFGVRNNFAVVTSAEHVGATRSFIARLHLYGLGWWYAGVLRLVGARYRRLWVLRPTTDETIT